LCKVVDGEAELNDMGIFGDGGGRTTPLGSGDESGSFYVENEEAAFERGSGDRIR